MSFRHPAPALAFASLLVLVSAPAYSAEPSTSDCLSAADHSLTLRRSHKLRAAHDQLLVCGAAACPAEVRSECLRRLDDVNAAMPTIAFEMKDASGGDLAGVKVTVDGEIRADSLTGTAMSVDPGAHTFRFDASGTAPVEKSFVIVEGQKERRERIQFGAPPSVGPSSASPALVTTSTVAQPDTSSSVSPPRSRTLAWTLIGGGALVALGGGIVMGLETSKGNDANGSHDRTAYDAAHAGWTVGLVASIVGGTALAAGAILFAIPGSRRGEAASHPVLWFGLSVDRVQFNGAW